MAKDRKFWADRYVELLQKKVDQELILKDIIKEKGYICYDEKTPSGTIHIGSGRGWVIHDTVARALRDIGLNGRFILSADDFDPMDALPLIKSDFYKQYMGIPFKYIPSPVDGYASYADYYFEEATSKFDEYGIEAELESTGNHYINGDFNKTIKLALDNADKIQEIFTRFYSNTVMSKKLPFNPICEKCNKIGTTIGYKWNKEEEKVSYRCSPDLVEWATGCGHEGMISPYNGNGKFPWKVEWAAKWPTIGVVFETAGKDHFSAGGSRDISIAIAREVFDFPPPFPSSYKKTENGYKYKVGEAYEFFTIDGAKMSTSKGSGFSFAEMGNFAPGHIIKYLLARKRPKSTIEFDPIDGLGDVYRDYDKTEKMYYEAIMDKKLLENDVYFNAHRLFQLCYVGKFYDELPPQIEFKFGVMLVQITDTTEQAIERLKEKGHIDSDVGEDKLDRLKLRLNFLRKWVKDLAPEDKIIKISSGKIKNIGEMDKKFITDVITTIRESNNDENKLREGFRTVYSNHNLSPSDFHSKIYKFLFNKNSGPRLVPYIVYTGEKKIIDRFEFLIK
ncbi:MAG: Lysine--tRNA ligase [Candidatus Heimdallarchaeota archaeon LC_3]|nr:MAG: Lysine--tRNA ligase [Candidatus Heimdallarchaeota archaeon LC_3]